MFPQLFAIKSVKKKQVVRDMMVKYVNQERRILSLVSHPFIVAFHAAFMDSKFLYLVLDVARCGCPFSKMN